MNEQIQKTLAAIKELPECDQVHCYDYEISTDDLKALAEWVEAVDGAWSKSWDCSRDPGHGIMEAATRGRVPCEHDWNPIGDYCINCGKEQP